MWHTGSLVVGLRLSRPAASGIIVPQPGIKTESPALEGFLTEPPGKTAPPLFFSSVQFSHSVVSDFLQPHELQHASPTCPSPIPGIHSNLRPSSQ